MIKLYGLCGTCGMHFIESELCTNEETGIKECERCYVEWRIEQREGI